MATRTTIRLKAQPGSEKNAGCAIADWFGAAWDAVSGVVTGGATAGMVPGCGPGYVWEQNHETIVDERKGYGLAKTIASVAALMLIIYLIIYLAK